MIRKIQAGLLPIAFLAGCAELQDHHAQFVNNWRARRAWHQCTTLADRFQISDDYRRGWLDGYSDVLMGGSGNPPSVPPACYWSACNQDCNGLERINLWYNGFRRGAVAAQAAGYWTEVPIQQTGGPCPTGCPACPTPGQMPCLYPREVAAPTLISPTPGPAPAEGEEAPPAPAAEDPMSDQPSEAVEPYEGEDGTIPAPYEESLDGSSDGTPPAPNETGSAPAYQEDELESWLPPETGGRAGLQTERSALEQIPENENFWREPVSSNARASQVPGDYWRTVGAETGDTVE